MRERTDIDVFAITRVDDRNWVVQNHRFAPGDPRHVVGAIREDDDEFEVVWLQPMPLPARYISLDAVMDDLQICTRRQRGGTRPVPIPHMPPHTRLSTGR